MTGSLDTELSDHLLSPPDSKTERLRVLWLSPYLPLPLSGAGSRVFHLIKELSRSCEIDLIATSNEWHDRHELADDLRSFCASVQSVSLAAQSRRERRFLQLRSLGSRHPAQYWTMYSQEMQQCIDERVRTTPYDLAIAEHSFTGYYQVPPGLPLVVDQHNIESEIMQRASQQDRSIARRALNRVEFLKYRKDEQWICRRADLLLAVSERDRAAMQAWGSIPDCRVIPNGVDVRSFSSELYPDAEIEGNVVFTGTLHYGPNTEAVLHFGREIWPLVRERVPGAIFTVIGAHPPPEIVQLGSIPGITVQGLVPDVRPYLAGAQVVVAPLRYGGGTRLKILEAFAMKRAVVSTTVGYEGLDVTEGTHLLVADEPEAFAEKISVLLRDPSLREALGRAGRRLVEERYDWQAAGDVLEKALLDLKYKALSRSHPRRDP